MLEKFNDFEGAIKDFKQAVNLEDDIINLIYNNLNDSNHSNYKIYLCLGIVLSGKKDLDSCKFLNKAKQYIDVNNTDRITYNGKITESIIYINNLIESNKCSSLHPF